MNERQSLQVCAAAHEVFGEQIDTSIVQSDDPEHPGCRVVLSHRQLGRIVTLHHREDWEPLRDCWRTVLSDAPLVEQICERRHRNNLWSFWH